MIDVYIRKLRPYFKIQKCKDCECFQLAISELEKYSLKHGKVKLPTLSKMEVTKNIHPCLGCDPCPPADILADFYKQTKRP